MLAFLKMYTSDMAVAKIARTLGVHRATVYRFIMPEAFELVADELERDSARHAAT
jgi:transposase-like protein